MKFNKMYKHDEYRKAKWHHKVLLDDEPEQTFMSSTLCYMQPASFPKCFQRTHTSTFTSN